MGICIGGAYMKKCLADIVKLLAFEMVERLGSTKEKDIINDFKYTYLKLTYYISKNRKLEIFRVDNDCRRKKCDFIVDYFKVYDVAKYMVVRYYDKYGKEGFDISRFATKDAALKFAEKIEEKDKVIFLREGELTDENFEVCNIEPQPLLEKLFLEQLDFADEYWKEVAEDR